MRVLRSLLRKQRTQAISHWLTVFPPPAYLSPNLASVLTSTPTCPPPLREHCTWARRQHGGVCNASAAAASWPCASPPHACSALVAQLHQHRVPAARGLFGFPGNNDLSKQYDERRLVGYSPEQLFEVVADVENYHHFVPWCQRSVIVTRHRSGRFDAELEVGFKVFVERYTSEVHLHPPQRVISRVNDSTLFDHLDTTWEFQSGPTPRSCWLTFSTDFAFKSPLYGQLASVFFQEVTRQMMGAFEERCRQRFGASAFEQSTESRMGATGRS